MLRKLLPQADRRWHSQQSISDVMTAVVIRQGSQSMGHAYIDCWRGKVLLATVEPHTTREQTSKHYTQDPAWEKSAT